MQPHAVGTLPNLSAMTTAYPTPEGITFIPDIARTTAVGYRTTFTIEGIPGYQPFFVPDFARTFVVDLHRHISDANVNEIQKMYETFLLHIDKSWPCAQAVYGYMDNDGISRMLYRHLWYRYVYAVYSPPLVVRVCSWYCYTDLFQASTRPSLLIVHAYFNSLRNSFFYVYGM